LNPIRNGYRKGKQEYRKNSGLKVCIIEDRCGFILNHRIMQHEQDVDVAVPFVKETKALYPNLKKCSFDKGFHSPSNKKELSEILDTVISSVQIMAYLDSNVMWLWQ